ncbi:MAG TPA: hypothetical protein VMU59_14295 [Caulobacteraceae bacterium]|nr:hypothetical protein [Caulobacteraceae bacterium]
MSDVQNPQGGPKEALEMPEVSWVWRRVYAFALTALMCALLYLLVARVQDAETLRYLATGLLLVIVLLVLVYVVGATVTDLRRLGAAVESKSLFGRFVRPPGGPQ